MFFFLFLVWSYRLSPETPYRRTIVVVAERDGSITLRMTGDSSGTDRPVRVGTATTNPDKDCSSPINRILFFYVVVLKTNRFRHFSF